ncbi:MAG: hypothetical protein OXG30_05300, partial [bacterium]|nr:hypothetical protein [bacterium]
TATARIWNTAAGKLPAAAGKDTATYTIEDDDVSIAGFAEPATPATEGATAQVTVSLSGSAPQAFALEFALSGTAEPFGDYWAPSARGLVAKGRVQVPAGATSAPIAVTVSDDAEPEGAETAVLTLIDPGVDGVDLDPDALSHTLTIAASDGDGPAGDAVQAGWDYDSLEGGRRTAWLESSELVLPISVSPAAKADFRVAVTLEPEAAAGLWAPTLGPGGDIYEARHTAVVKAGETSAKISVPMIDNNIVEDDWTWVADLEVSGAALGAEAVSARRELEVVVRDDDQAEVLFERRGGPAGNIWVVLSRPVRFDLNVRVLTRGGLASPDVDFGAYRTETGGLLTAVDTGVTSLADIRFVHVGVAASDRPAWLFSGHPCIVGTSLSGPPPADPPACGDYRLHEHHRVDISRPRGVVPTVRLAPAPAEVPADWALVPSGLSVGDRFRLLFLTSTKHPASSADIGDYNALVQAAAAAGGHQAIRGHSEGFRVVGSTAAVDARDNALLGGPGAPVYWLGGAKAADGSADFCDGSWDSRAARDESGAAVALVDEETFIANGIWTGTGHDCTARAGHELGSARPQMASAEVVSGSAHGPLRVAHPNAVNQPNTHSRRLYAVSETFEVAAAGGGVTEPVENPDGTWTVPADWALRPSGVGGGQPFRLLFRTSSRGDATATDIAVYDQRVRDAIAGGSLDAMKALGSGFKAVGSTQSVDARDHLGMRDGPAWRLGVPVYWMDDGGDGKVVAYDYADFCTMNAGSSGSPELWWRNDLLADQRDENGQAFSGDNNWPWTGTASDCTKRANRWLGHTSDVEVGAHRDGRTWGPLSNGRQAPSESNSLYGMSPVITAEADPGTEGDVLAWELTADPKPAVPLVATVEVSQDGNWVAPGHLGWRHVVIGPSGRAVFTVPTVDDATDEPDGAVTLSLAPQYGPGGFRIGRPGGASQPVADNDPAGSGGQDTIAAVPEVSVVASAGGTEGADVQFMVAASPAPTAPLAVTVTVTQDGDWLAPGEAGQRTVTIGTTGTATVRLATVDDSADEPNGSVTLTIQAGSGYTLGTPAAEKAAVHDDDDPPAQQQQQQAPAVDTSEAEALIDAMIARHRDVTGNQGALANWQKAQKTIRGEPGGFTVAELEAHTAAVEPGEPRNRWNKILAAAKQLAAAQQQQQGSSDDAALPEIRIGHSSSPIAEGGDAGFVITAVPAPAEPLTVAVTVAGGRAASGHTGQRAITVPASGIAGITVATADDQARTPAGDITATVNTGAGYTVSATRGTAAVAVQDDDPAPKKAPPPAVPEISVTAGAGITEGQSASFTITASPAPKTPLTVTVAVAQTGDWGAATGTATVVIPTTGSAAHTVATAGDEVDEADGSVTVAVSAGTGYTVSAAKGAASVDVSDDDDPAPAAAPEIAVAAGPAIAEGQSAVFTVTATPAPEAPLTVSVAVIQSGDLGAAAGPATVVIPTTGSAAHTVATAGDSTDEPDGSITLTLRAGSGYAVSPGRPAATVAVSDDDPPPPPPKPTCRTSDAALLAEVLAKAGDPWNGARPDLVDTFGRAHATMLGADTYTTADLKARPDRQTPNWQGAGPNALWQDIYAELDRLQACRAKTPQTPPPPAVVPQVSVTAGPAIAEGQTAAFTITASPPPPAPLSVVVTVTQAGDYGAALGAQTVVIPTGGTTAFSVATAGDGADEPDGSVTLTLNAGSGYTVSATSGSAAVAVADDDPPPQDPDTPDTDPQDDPDTPDTDPQDDPPPPPPVPDPVISVTAGPGIAEGQSAAFTVTAAPAPKAPLTVTVTVTQTGDYGTATGTRTVVIPTGGTKTVAVATAGDNTDEADGTVTLTVDAGSGYTVSTAHGAATVAVADDDVPQISVAAGPGITEGASAVFTVTATPAPAGPLTVTVTVTQTGDYGVVTGARTVVVPTSGAAKLAVATTGDNTDETDGTVTLTAGTGTGYTVSTTQNTATVAVADDDNPPPPPAGRQIKIADAAAAEGGRLRFAVTLTETFWRTITVDYQITGITAQQGTDWHIPRATGTVSFRGGQTYQEISVLALPDNRAEGDETLQVTLTNPRGPATLANATATGTIKDTN